MKLSETIRGLPVAIEVSEHQRRFIRKLADEVAQLEAENEAHKRALKAIAGVGGYSIQPGKTAKDIARNYLESPDDGFDFLLARKEAP